jgi:CheY-like chemotaxis protein
MSQSTKQERATMHTPKILIVDDSEVGRNLLLGQIGYLGLAGELAANGEEAISKAKVGQYDLILMDIFMPGIDGIETASRIRAEFRLTGRKHIPILAVTGGADRQLCLTSGLDDYVNKPILIDDLRRVIARWLPGEFAKVEQVNFNHQ